MLLRRILIEKRLVALPLGVGLLINVFVYAGVVYPLVVKSADAGAHAAAATAALKAAQDNHASANELLSGKDRAERALTTFYNKVVPGDLAAARRITYARLPALARRANVRYDAGTFEIDRDDKNAKLGRLHIHLILQGDYENLRQFIYALEVSPDFVIIDDVTLAQPDAGMPLTLTLELSTYFRTHADGA